MKTPSTKRPSTPRPSQTAETVGQLIDRYGISQAELKVLSKALTATIQTEGWVLVERILDKFHKGIPMEALRDTGPNARAKDYYLGQVDFIEAFTAMLHAIAAQSEETDQPGERGGGHGDRLIKMLRPGRGPLL